MGKEKKDKTQKAERTLTAAEQRRLEAFEKVTEEMKQQSYTRKDLTIDLAKANVNAAIFFLPLVIISTVLFFVFNRMPKLHIYGLIITMAVYVVSILIHELIHGICWGIASGKKFKDIEFGYVAATMNPYCTCSSPLTRVKYIFGAVMPLMLLGIVPIVVGIIIGNFWVMLFGVISAICGAGDVMIIGNILGYKTTAKDIVYMDHPTEGGGVIFER